MYLTAGVLGDQRSTTIRDTCQVDKFKLERSRLRNLYIKAAKYILQMYLVLLVEYMNINASPR